MQISKKALIKEISSSKSQKFKNHQTATNEHLGTLITRNEPQPKQLRS